MFSLEMPSYTMLLVDDKDVSSLTAILNRATLVKNEYDPRDDVYDKYLVECNEQRTFTWLPDKDAKIYGAETWDVMKKRFMEEQNEVAETETSGKADESDS